MSYMTKPTYAQNKAFKDTFGRTISGVWDYFTGSLDVIALDEWLQVPDGTSTRDYIESKYGIDAVNMVLGLMKGKR